MKWKLTVVGGIVIGALAVPLPSSGTPTEPPSASRMGKPSAVQVTVPADVTEGDSYVIGVTVAKPRRYKRILVQRSETDVLGRTEWVTQRRFKPRRKLSLGVTAGVEDHDRFRALAIPKTGKLKKSRPAATRVWHWYPLTDFDSYYETSGIINSDLVSFPMNGVQYKGWRTYGSYRAWEARFTPGRNCSRFRGDFGLHDASDDGSSASIQITTDGDRVAYRSPTLTPGVTQRATLDLQLTYRMSISATDLSPDGIKAAPAIGAGELLCTGFEG